ncbi:MAG: L-aspartate oxidase [Candidatus Lambdaproteobacteria bacterium RIFOXYD2_FULL_50_16]|uniref:L-aspartate oxidase n=1 Tax=Candidatus Lambdaproteobacteria bacterium RIFOXYD2_FULL_50_16 TaxID=1817772 RepID=A0A1F6GBH1_9PROT|nr:MAG: L-aspartate oxidase [Candidatus Lambdaproteobacteria bacterium RIFOXYD2_FULL_50_16]
MSPIKPEPLVIFGTGIGGLMTALMAAEHGPVTLFTKAKMGDTNTSLAQGGIATVWREDDSAELHIQDTLKVGGGINDVAAVEVLCRLGRPAVEKLISLGVNFDRTHSGYRLALEGAHSLPRILFAGGDATGMEIQRALSEAVHVHPNIETVENAPLLSIEAQSGRVEGIRYLHPQLGPKRLDCHQLVLATGGAGRMFYYTANRETATGEPMAMALLAGGRLVDLEFFQFHPTALDQPGYDNYLISEAVRGEGAILVNEQNQAFMAGYHELKELASRDVVSRAIHQEILRSGRVYLDATKLKHESVEYRFPNIFHHCFSAGIDIRKEPIPVSPVAHYMMGGLATDLWGRAHIPGLYAAGEVTRTGVHGSGRLASNSLLEGAVFGMRVAQAVLADQKQVPQIWEGPLVPSPALETPSSVSRPLERTEFRKLMWEHASLIRNESGLKQLITRLDQALGPVPDGLDYGQFELWHMIYLGRLLAQAALLRTESRGSHYREDFPTSLPAQQGSIRHRLGFTPELVR